MAESIAREIADERGMRDIEVGSAGTAAWEGAPASDGALLVSLEHGVDISMHRARPVTPELLAQYDLVLAMSPHHLERVEALGARGKAFLLTSYATHGSSNRAVGDPFGGELEAYRETYQELQREIRRAFDRLAAERTPGRP
jgi:protein-tyrosine-phosphatase